MGLGCIYGNCYRADLRVGAAVGPGWGGPIGADLWGGGGNDEGGGQLWG